MKRVDIFGRYLERAYIAKTLKNKNPLYPKKEILEKLSNAVNYPLRIFSLTLSIMPAISQSALIR